MLEPSLFIRLINRRYPESTKRAQLIVATASLVFIAVIIALPIAWRIHRTGDVGMGTVYALGAATGPLAILAGASYRKKETPLEEKPGTPNEEGRV